MVERHTEIEETTLGQIISRDYRKSRVLTRFGVDFSCGGGQTLDQALGGHTKELQDVLQEWQQIDGAAPERKMDFLGWDMAFLANYIIQLHHRFVGTQTRFVTELAFKVANSNSTRHPDMKAVADIFAAAGGKLELKGKQEEKELFPYIMALEEARSNGGALQAASFGSVSVPITAVKSEGEQIVAALKQIRSLTKNYVPPAYTTSTCPILYKLLEAYEEDALLHLHLENNILFPKAIQTEQSLWSKGQIIQTEFN
jgi:regulator of cell morphogenesis and NO signaling